MPIVVRVHECHLDACDFVSWAIDTIVSLVISCKRTVQSIRDAIYLLGSEQSDRSVRPMNSGMLPAMLCWECGRLHGDLLDCIRGPCRLIKTVGRLHPYLSVNIAQLSKTDGHLPSNLSVNILNKSNRPTFRFVRRTDRIYLRFLFYRDRRTPASLCSPASR